MGDPDGADVEASELMLVAEALRLSLESAGSMELENPADYDEAAVIASSIAEYDEALLA